MSFAFLNEDDVKKTVDRNQFIMLLLFISIFYLYNIRQIPVVLLFFCVRPHMRKLIFKMHIKKVFEENVALKLKLHLHEIGPKIKVSLKSLKELMLGKY